MSPVLPRLAVVLALALFGCSDGDVVSGGEHLAPPPSGGALAGEITVSGPVSRVLDAYVFEIGTDGGEPVLVVAPGGPGPLVAGVAAEVTGTVETFDVAAIQPRIRAPLNPELHRLNGRRCVVARTVKARAGAG